MFWILRRTGAATFFNSINNNCSSKSNLNNNNASASTKSTSTVSFFKKMSLISVMNMTNANTYSIVPFRSSLIRSMSSSSAFSDVNNDCNDNMVNARDKCETSRIAIAKACLYVGRDIAEQIRTNSIAAGEVLSASQIAGTMVSELLPSCPNSPLSSVNVKAELDLIKNAVNVQSTVISEGKSGIEIEALLCCTAAVYTVYDMCKDLSKDIVIGDVMLMHKFGGQTSFSRIGDGKVLEPIALKEYETKLVDPLEDPVCIVSS